MPKGVDEQQYWQLAARLRADGESRRYLEKMLTALRRREDEQRHHVMKQAKDLRVCVAEYLDRLREHPGALPRGVSDILRLRDLWLGSGTAVDDLRPRLVKLLRLQAAHHHLLLVECPHRVCVSPSIVASSWALREPRRPPRKPATTGQQSSESQGATQLAPSPASTGRVG